MKLTKTLFVAAAALLLVHCSKASRGFAAPKAQATHDNTVKTENAVAVTPDRLVVYTAELGVGKFHRYDNNVHPYPANSAWTPYVLPKDAGTTSPVIQKNKDGSVTIFFSNLDELLTTLVSVSKEAGQKISVLNVHGHGLPGAMWFPKDAATEASNECADWRQAATAEDKANYDQYYSPVQKDEIMMIRQMADSGGMFGTPCTTGLPEWQAAVDAHSDVKAVFADDMQTHILSCVVGLGQVGEQYTSGMAQLLAGSSGRVSTSMDFGLGDWSMPDGMGFWDYQNDQQLDHDNSIYPKDHQDSEIAQLGSIRVAMGAKASTKSGILANVKVMPLGYETSTQAVLTGAAALKYLDSFGPMSYYGELPMEMPSRIRIPGTAYTVEVRKLK